MTHASRDTTTGLQFEKANRIDDKNGIDLSKTKLCKFVKEKGVNPLDYLSWLFQPDEAYYYPEINKVIIYEKKNQNCNGSADEKLGACAWKIQEYKALFNAIGIDDVSYIYILSDWFKNPRYVKLLKYIKSTDGCDYMFMGE